MPASKTTTRRDLAQVMADNTGLSRLAAQEALAQTLDALSQCLVVPGDAVSLRGFGRFEVRVRQARVYRDPTDHTRTVTRPATSFIHFKASANDPRR